ncbi:hypothetical protein [Massilia niastensis]|uniref:hypothetical protein n=1 Tax=Massilia niastensis TaxID=544911 RepID=UPI00036CEF9A|nr:hypothetical protein [Massilia niastensis]
MPYLDHVIRVRQAALRRSALCSFMADDAIPPPRRLGFIPAMIFFMVGFKDILAALRGRGDAPPAGHGARWHADDDAWHWRWYLLDLAAIDHGRRQLEPPAAGTAEEPWAPMHHASREVVEQAVFLARTYRTPFQRMAVGDALAATLACFNDPIYRMVSELGLGKRLHYFGRVEAQAEGEARRPGLASSAAEAETAVLLVNEVFDAVEGMFDCWMRVRVAGAPRQAPA